SLQKQNTSNLVLQNKALDFSPCYSNFPEFEFLICKIRYHIQIEIDCGHKGAWKQESFKNLIQKFGPFNTRFCAHVVCSREWDTAGGAREAVWVQGAHLCSTCPRPSLPRRPLLLAPAASGNSLSCSDPRFPCLGTVKLLRQSGREKRAFRVPQSPQCGREGGKKFLYSEPHKRIKEVLEEELYIKRDECHIKNPPAVALERIWSIKRNLPVGNLKPELPSRNSLLPQTTYYSRHGGLRR
uniref:Ankyrin repeat domain 49 n=1 Tax=Canis lupus familiaris TaxID=9615 RepID=A0A8C0STQ0_CANLF